MAEKALIAENAVKARERLQSEYEASVQLQKEENHASCVRESQLREEHQRQLMDEMRKRAALEDEISRFNSDLLRKEGEAEILEGHRAAWESKYRAEEQRRTSADERVISCVEALRLHQAESLLGEEDLLTLRTRNRELQVSAREREKDLLQREALLLDLDSLSMYGNN